MVKELPPDYGRDKKNTSSGRLNIDGGTSDKDGKSILIATSQKTKKLPPLTQKEPDELGPKGDPNNKLIY